jgi:hypothetical protein
VRHEAGIKTEQRGLLLCRPIGCGPRWIVRFNLTGRLRPRRQSGDSAAREPSINPSCLTVAAWCVGPAEGGWDDTKDAWITARVRSELVLDRDIRSSNYTIDTENGSIYLIGSARSQGELDQAMRVARYVPGVKRVVSYMEIRSGAPVAAGPAPTSTTGAGTPSFAPSAPIEVQKL